MTKKLYLKRDETYEIWEQIDNCYKVRKFFLLNLNFNYKFRQF